MSDDKNKIRLRKNKVVTDRYLSFLLELHTDGVDIGEEDTQLLKETGYLKDDAPIKSDGEPTDKINKYALDHSQKNKEYDSRIDIVIESGKDFDGSLLKIISDSELEDRRNKGGYKFEGREEPISVEEWMPESVTEHSKEFIEWVISINLTGFENRKQYRKLNLYVQQAYTWLADRKYVTDFNDEFDREEFMLQELKRCLQNTLYFVNKYGYYKDGNVEGGVVKYVAWPSHEVMLYLNDAGYSQAITKGRQIAATTTQMLCDLKDALFKRNHFMKFVTEDKEKAQEIFEDKLKFPFSQLPDWMKSSVINDRENFFKLGEKEGKGGRAGVNSSIRVVAPKPTVIAGGAPNKAKIDEAGNIGILSKMIEDQRPTMLMYDPKTGKIRVKRQLVFWGTGGEMDSGGKAFETEFMSIWEAWQKHEFSSCIVPIFFNWTARPGATQEDYDREKKVAYSKVGPDLKESIIKFHQTWPTTLADVFRSSGKGLVSEDFIRERRQQIIQAQIDTNHTLTKKGYFEPIFDTTRPDGENSDMPYHITGVNFIPCEDHDPRATVTIFKDPDKKSRFRYYQGTDPIMADSGISKMASAIWDKHLKTVSAIVNCRSDNPKQDFLQVMLLGLYYDCSEIREGVKELVESNIGINYCDYKEAKGYGSSTVLNFELPNILMNRTAKNDGRGIDNKVPRTRSIIDRLHEVISAFGERIYIDVFWTQLETFVCKVTNAGNETWEPSNKRYFRDDVLFAVVYAYICAEQCGYPEPVVDLNKARDNYQIVYETRYNKDWQLVRVPVRKMVA